MPVFPQSAFACALLLCIALLYLSPSSFASIARQSVIDELAHPHLIPPAPAGPVLRSALIITRHGDRTPIKTFPNTKSVWPEGLGQLTWLGMEQHYELGQMFRKRYVEEHGLVGSEYRGSEVYVRSTSKERTLMSAQSFMHGFYPPTKGSKRLPGGLQPVPIHAFAKHQDIVLYAYKNCPRIKDMQHSVKQGTEWREMEEKTEKLRANLSTLFGAELGLKHFTSLATLLKQELIHNKQMIEGFPMEHLETIKSMGEWVLRQKYATREMGSLGSGKIFEEIISTMRPHLTATKPAKDSPKFVLLSAHDGTLLALLTALNVPDFHIPPFAAYLAFELYTWPDDATGERAFVKVVYNGEPLSLPGCQVDGQCAFADFEQLLRESTSPNWYEACGAEICFEKDLVLDIGAAKKSVSKKVSLEDHATHDNEQLKKRKLNAAAATEEAEVLEKAAPGRVGGLEFIMLATGLMLGFSVVPLKNLLFPPAAEAGLSTPKSKRSKKSGKSQTQPFDDSPRNAARRVVSVKSS
jgi:hypothetical protein